MNGLICTIYIINIGTITSEVDAVSGDWSKDLVYITVDGKQGQRSSNL